MSRALLLLLLPALAAASCISECIKADTYYNKNCPDGIKLDDECEEEDFCSTPYSRCMDGKCKCLPEFVPRNVTYGQAAICVPEGTASPANARDPTADICRYANPKADTQFYEDRLMMATTSEEYNRLVLPAEANTCPVGCEKEARRVKRETSYVLPPTVVSSCRSGQLCFQLGPSAYGVCKEPRCPVGKPGSTKTPCQLGHDETCPNGYHCQATGGQSYDIKTNSYTDATICCPSICDNGYYRAGRCWRDQNCLVTMDNCEDRCDYVPCRFMVDPCQNFGMCLVPKTAAGVSPDYFWCKCPPQAGKAGRVCEIDGMDLNRPSKSRRIKCEGSLCEAPPRPAYRAIPAPSLTAPSVYQPAGALKTDVNTKRKPCRQDVFSECTQYAARGACMSSRAFMVSNCDCACTKWMNKDPSITFYPVSFTSGNN